MNIIIKKDETRKGTGETAFIVFDGDRFIGLVTKIKDTKGYTHPWKALGTYSAPNKPNKFLGSFFKANGYKEAAIAAVVANNGASE